MKKTILYTMAAATLMLGSCSLDVNDDPNNPTSVEPNLVLPAAETALATAVGDGLYNPAGFFVQYYDQLPESEQYWAIARYDFHQSDGILDRSYRNMFAGALPDLNQILNSDDATAADKYVATVLRAFTFQLAVDNWDQVPYTEATQGGSTPNPRWDDGQSVYEGVLNELDSVENMLDGSAITATDMVASQSLSQWQGFANALRLRMYLRFIDAGVDASSYTSKVQQLLSANDFFTGDIKFDNFANEADRRNPWYSTNYQNLNTTNHAAGYALVSYLKATGDNARLTWGFEPAADSSTGDILGCLPNKKTPYSSTEKDGTVSELKYFATKPVYFFTQAELQFLIAEAQLRFNSNDAAAKAAYEAGIEADYSARGLSGASSLYGNGGAVAWSGSQADKLNLIYMQKWVSLFYMDHMEAWSEQRRTNVPTTSSATAEQIHANPTVYTAGQLISPFSNALGEGVFPKRQWFPYDAAQYNPNTPAAVNITQPVWWDKN